MSTNILDNFDLSRFPGAEEHIRRNGLVQRRVDNVVSDFQIDGHDRGVAYRFFTEGVPNKAKTDAALGDFEINDDVDMIEFYVTKEHKPVERCTHLPADLLKFSKHKNPEGGRDCIGGLFKDAYLAFKAGRSSPGLELSRWGRLSLGQVRTLNSAQIFTVEQFAAMPRTRIQGVLPKEFLEAFEAAIMFVNGQKGFEDVKKYANEVLEMKQQNAKQKSEMDELRAKIEAMMNAPKDSKAKKTSKAKSGRKTLTKITEDAEDGTYED